MNLSGSSEGLLSQVDEALHVVALAERLELGGRWLDIGSGGGFPGLVIAACLPVELTLVEPRERRAAVLELGLRKMEVERGRVLRGRVDGGRWQGIDGAPAPAPAQVASARAVFKPAKWVEEARHWLQPGGVAILHLHAGDPAPAGFAEIARTSGAQWTVAAGQVN